MNFVLERTALVGAALACLALVGGCGGGTLAQVHIVGGEAVSEASPLARHVVALTQTNGRILCSGVLLAEGVVLTAAHCLPSLRMVWRPTLSFSTRGESSWLPEISAPNPKVRRMTHVVYHAGFNQDAMDDEPALPPHDVGLVFFEGAAPEGYSPARFSTGERPNREGKGAFGSAVWVAGYGVGGTHAADSGLLRLVETAWSRDFPAAGLMQFGPLPGRGACYGDSGGPVFVADGLEGDVLVQALVSYGPEEGASGPDCEQGRFYATPVQRYQDWIEKNAGVDLASGRRRAPEPTEARGFAL